MGACRVCRRAPRPGRRARQPAIRPSAAAAAAGRAPRAHSRRATGTSPHREAGRRPLGATPRGAARPPQPPAWLRRRRKTRPTRTAQARPSAAAPRRSAASCGASRRPDRPWRPRPPPRPEGPPGEPIRTSLRPRPRPRPQPAHTWPTPAGPAPTARPGIVAGRYSRHCPPARPRSSQLYPLELLPSVAPGRRPAPWPGGALPHAPPGQRRSDGPRGTDLAGLPASQVFEHRFARLSSQLHLRSKLQEGSDKMGATTRRPGLAPDSRTGLPHEAPARGSRTRLRTRLPRGAGPAWHTLAAVRSPNPPPELSRTAFVSELDALTAGDAA